MKLINRIFTPNSILNNKENFVPINIGNRPRYATCTSVCWLDNNTLISLNLYGDKIVVYNFNEEKNEFTIIQQIENKDGAELSMSEHFSLSPCKKFLAVCGDVPKSCVNIYLIDKVINPAPIYTIKDKSLIHNVRFNPNGKYLSYITFDNKESIKIFNIRHNNNEIEINNILIRENEYKSIRAKAINFTKDGKFVVICYGTAAMDSKHSINSMIVSYYFKEDGTIGGKISEIEGNISPEDIIFINDDNNILISDQANDKLINYKFNKINGEIGSIEEVIENPLASLSFPHGMSMSDDNKYLAVSNYGDDNFNVYKL